MTIKIIGYLAIFLFCWQSSICQNKDTEKPLSLKVKAQTVNCSSSAELNFSVTLRNEGKSKLAIDSNGIGEVMMFSLIRVSNDGATVASKNTIDERSKDDRPRFVLLEPKDGYSKFFRISLEDEFFSGAESFEFVTAYRFLSSAKYNGRDVWTGTVYSDPVTVFLKDCSVNPR